MDEPTLRHSDFEVFYRAQWEEIYRPLAVVLRDPDLAREATDEAITRALWHWQTVKAANNQAGWVYRVAHNWAVDQIRQRRRRVPKGTAVVTLDVAGEPLAWQFPVGETAFFDLNQFPTAAVTMTAIGVDGNRLATEVIPVEASG